MFPSPHLWFLHAKQRILDQNFKSLWVPALICDFCMPNSEFWPRITSLYVSQTSSVVLSTHKSVLSTSINRLYWFQLSPVVLFMQISVISTKITSLYGSQPSSVVFAFKTATFGPVYESLCVPDLTCRFVHAKQRDLHQNIKLTWVPAFICCFVHAKQRL